jgi:hypothetical protein
VRGGKAWKARWSRALPSKRTRSGFSMSLL